MQQTVGGATQVRKIGHFKPVRFQKPDRFESLKNIIVILTCAALPNSDELNQYVIIKGTGFVGSQPRSIKIQHKLN